jgi:hypothetical protein
MSNSRRPWSEDEIAKLKSMAGRFPSREIATALGRSPGAIMVEASKLKISLSTRSASTGYDAGAAGVTPSQKNGLSRD